MRREPSVASLLCAMDTTKECWRLRRRLDLLPSRLHHLVHCTTPTHPRPQVLAVSAARGTSAASLCYLLPVILHAAY
ncbi:hypothetical protein E2C01_008642 [Portunus trituberculatus]|uniref:Uncharacterized protein n=1 Tax=Portunus trituberculatus TaxID=210409 RepID=A0A5B7D2I2_PORTR|nr:hypothetical protein [Portunus trituberculatus]